MLASLSGRGVVCASQRFDCKLGVMDVFGDKDCTNAAAVWHHIGTCFPDQTGVNSKKFLSVIFRLDDTGLISSQNYEI